MEGVGKYDELMTHQRHHTRHPHLSMNDRAAQFEMFEALEGLDEKILGHIRNIVTTEDEEP